MTDDVLGPGRERKTGSETVGRCDRPPEKGQRGILSAHSRYRPRNGGTARSAAFCLWEEQGVDVARQK